MHAPLFWKDKTLFSTALLPAAAILGFFAKKRQADASPLRLSIPVICVGNVVAGGSGKTPVALALGAMLAAQGKQAHYLSRGYKGRLKGPVRVDPEQHTAEEVGDEPLLLARRLPTWVAKDRAAGAGAAVAAGAEAIVMDDGFQNPALHKDVSLMVIDGAYGFGNGRLIPSGPLREAVSDAMARASAVIIMGEDKHHVLAQVPGGLPVLRARIEPLAEAHALRGVPVVAFAGIARPRKFHRTLRELGCDVRNMIGYGDHHAFTPRDIAFLRAQAKKQEARLVTTAKDYARLPIGMRAEVTQVPVQAVFEDDAALLALMTRALRR